MSRASPAEIQKAMEFLAPDPFEYQRQVGQWVMRICRPGQSRVQRELLIAQVPGAMAALVVSKAQVAMASAIAADPSLERRREALAEVPESWLPHVRTMVGDFYAAKRAGRS